MSEIQQLILGLKKFDHKTALIHKTPFRSFPYTYHQIYDYIYKMSSFFSLHKVKKGDRVLIWGPNSPEYVVSLLGCFLFGVVAVPVDIKHPLDMVKRIKKHSGAHLVLCPAEYPRIGSARVNLSDLFYHLDELSPKKKFTKLPEHALAEIIYTSGTTGIPKGVMLSHKNLGSNIRQLHLGFPLQDERILNVLPLSHSFSQVVTFFPLFFGNVLVLLDVLKPTLLLESMKEHKITLMPTVPRLLDSLKHKLPAPARLTSRFAFGRQFRYFISGGAPLSLETQSFFSSIGYECYVGYGLTETSPVLALTYPGRSRHGAAGIAVADTTIKIADDGEVLVKGPQVFSGYYKNAAKTKEVFSKGWFCTGDIGKIDNDGFLILHGRKKDTIVTSAGVNVYPEDIESVLNKHTDVGDSCVIGIGKDNDYIHAVLLLKKNVSAKKIISEANLQLDQSSHIIEWSVWPEPDFPRTPTAKVRKFLVKEWVEQRKGKKTTAKQVSGDRLVSVIARLSSKSIKESSTLESLGLSSLDRVELISMLEQVYSVDLDEDKFTGTLKVKELRQLLHQPVKIRKPSTWQLSWPVRLIRFFLTPLLTLCLARPFLRMSVKGKEHLKDLNEPTIFIANHTSHFDTVFLVWNLPRRFSSRLCPATWKEYFDSPSLLKTIGLKFLEGFAKILYPIFLLPQQSGARSSLHHMGTLLDKKYHILFFPEGSRTRTGKMLGFKSGIGLLVKNTKAPVVPVKIDGLFDVLPSDTFLPKPGNVTYTFGKPIRFTTESPLEITKELENVLKSM